MSQFGLPFDTNSGAAAGNGRRSVLVVGAASAAGNLLAGQLVARGFRVHCADIRPMDIPSATCHLISDASGFLPALARLVRTEGVDLVLPANSAVLSEISSGRVALGREICLVMPGPGPTVTAQDRLLTAWSLWSHGVPVPDFGVPSDFARAHATSPLLTGPLVVRPRRADGNQTTMLVEDPRDVDWNSVDDDLLVQEFVPGTSYKAIVYRPLQGKGRLTSVLEEVVLDDGQVVAAASTDAHAVPEIERVAQAAVRAVGLTGPAEVSLRNRGGGMPVVLDVRVGFGPHSHLVPELLDMVLRDFPARKPARSTSQRVTETPPPRRFGPPSARKLDMGAQL